MKKKKIFMLALMAAVASTATVTMASCDKEDKPSNVTPNPDPSNPSNPDTPDHVDLVVDKLVITGVATDFKAGTEFKTDEIKVVVKFIDGTEKDVTQDATVDASGVNANKKGTYKLIVKYGSYRQEVSINVSDAELTGISLDTSDVKTEYYLKDTVSLDGLFVVAEYSNGDTSDYDAGYTYVVKNSNGEEVTSLDSLGEYSVEVTYNGFSNSFKINVVSANYETLEDAIAGVVANDNKVNHGTVTSGSDESNATTTEFFYGGNYVKTVTSTGDTSSQEMYFSYDAANNILGVVVNVDGEEKNASIYDESLYKDKSTGKIYLDACKGYGFKNLTGGYSVTGAETAGAFGVGKLVESLYDEFSLKPYGGKYAEKGQCPHLDNEEGYKFGYNIIADFSYKYFRRVTVEFTTNEYGAVKNAFVNIEGFGYTDDLNNLPHAAEGAQASELESGDLVNVSTASDGTAIFTVKEGATPTSKYSYTINQEVGEKYKAEDAEYAIDNVVIKSFDVKEVKADGTKESVQDKYILDLDNGVNNSDDGRNYYILKTEIDGVTPETANQDLDKIEVTITGTLYNGTQLKGSSWDDISYVYYNKSEGTIKFNYPGFYQVSFKSYIYEKTFDVDVNPESPRSVSCSALVENGEKNKFETAQEYEIYQSNALYVKADIAANFDQTYKVELPEGVTGLHLEEAKVDGYNCYKFTADQAGVYTLKFVATSGSVDVDPVYTELTITVLENPNIAGILNGEYTANINGTKYSFVFTPESENALNGTVVVTDTTDSSKSDTLAYTYADGVISTSYQEGTELGIGFALASDYSLNATLGSNKFKCYKPGQSPEDLENIAKLINGTYTFSYMDSYDYTLKFTPSTNGSLSGKVSVVKVDTSWDQTTNDEFEYTYNSITGMIENESNEFKDKLVVIDGKIYYKTEFKSFELTKKTYNYAEILNGTYEAKIGSYTYTYVFKDGNLDITRTRSNGTKQTTSYTDCKYDEDLDLVTATIASGTNDYLKTYALKVIDGVLNYVSKEWNSDLTVQYDKYTELPRKEATVEILKKYYGSWINEDGARVVIDEKGVTVDDVGYKVISCDETTIVIEYDGSKTTLTYSTSMLSNEEENVDYYKYDATAFTNFKGQWIDADGNYFVILDSSYYYVSNGTTTTYNDYCLVIDNTIYLFTKRGSVYLELSEDGNSLSYQDENFVKQSIPEEFIGTWYGSNFILNVTANTFTFSYDSGSDTYDFEKCEDGVVYGTTPVLFGVGTVTLTMNEDGTITFAGEYDEYEFSKQAETGDSDDEPSTSVTIDSSFVGTWTGTLNGDTTDIDITETTVEVNGVSYEVSKCEEMDGVLTLIFYIKNDSDILSYICTIEDDKLSAQITGIESAVVFTSVNTIK